MLIGERIKAIRESKHLSQGDIEKRTGLLRCYISRVENQHTTPAVETLEKFARAMGVETYQLFYGGDAPQELALPKAASRRITSRERKEVASLARDFNSLKRSRDRKLVTLLTRKLARA
jgi:transcriptional regulator with XRE-family HTH domain